MLLLRRIIKLAFVWHHPLHMPINQIHRADTPATSATSPPQRENKLLRAGFEGRKQGFIDTPKRLAAGGQ